MSSLCTFPTPVSCVPVAGGSFSWMGCLKEPQMGIYSGYPITSDNSMQPGFYGSATECVKACGAGSYTFASIEPGYCFCGNDIDPNYLTRNSPGSCNTFCSMIPGQLCGGYFWGTVYSEAYQYIPGGSVECPALDATTSSSSSSFTVAISTSASPSAEPSATLSAILSSSEAAITPIESTFSTIVSSSALSSATSPPLSSSSLTTKTVTSTKSSTSSISPTGSPSCHNTTINSAFEDGVLAPWTSNFPDSITITNTPVADVIPFAPSQYVLAANIAGGQIITVQQTVSVCPSTKYAPLVSYQLAVDPAGGKKGPLICTFQFCELVTGTCGRVATMRAKKWGSNSPQFRAGVTQTSAILQMNLFCPTAAVAYVGRLVM